MVVLDTVRLEVSPREFPHLIYPTYQLKAQHPPEWC